MNAVAPQVTIDRYTPDQVADRYADWYRLAGGKSSQHHPGVVYVASLASGPVGILPCYTHTRSTGYLQFAGLFPGHRGIRALPYLKAALAVIHQDYPRLLAAVDRQNHVALKLALAAGFEITGTRLGGTPLEGCPRLLVELMREVDHAGTL